MNATPTDLESLFRDNVAFVRRLVRCFGVPAAEVDDVCQEVFLVVHRKLAAFDRGRPVRSWLYGIARRVASDHGSHAYRLRESPGGDLFDHAQVGATQHARAEEVEALDWLMIILDRLPPAQRVVFLLYEVEELSMREIAATVGSPLFTAYSRLRAARAEVTRAWTRQSEESGS